MNILIGHSGWPDELVSSVSEFDHALEARLSEPSRILKLRTAQISVSEIGASELGVAKVRGEPGSESACWECP